MLNPKELMLGNWVYESERSQFPMKVVNIDKDMVYLDFDSNQGDVFDGKMEDICPIPLTEEILLKNGFVRDYDVFTICDDKLEITNYGEDGFYITVEINEYKILPIKYVHQLQNILTIAGIDIEFKV